MADVVLSCDGHSGSANLEAVMADTFKEIFDLWKQRQRKYGTGNISAFGEIGCLVRGHDKMARLRRALIDSPELSGLAYDESVEDSWKDLANYAIMALVCRRGKWPNV